MMSAFTLAAVEDLDTAAMAASSATLTDAAWAEFCAAAAAAGLTPDAEARATLSAILLKEYPAFFYDRARVAAALKRSQRMLKQLDEFAELYRQAWLPQLHVDELQAILTGRACSFVADVKIERDETERNIAVKTERDLWALQNLWLRTQAVWLAASAIRRANARRKSVQREWLYHRLCSLWLDNFGGELKVRVPPLGGPPYGPLIDFMLAAFRQVASADELPSPETVRDAIDRENRERKRLRQLVELRTRMGD